jgi:serine/threonine protein kinase
MENLTGRQFGPYQIVAPLGEGGMAAVYKAYQPSMERYVALKVLPRHFASDPHFTSRFQREAKLLAKLQHPHILPVFDFGQSDEYSYIVMPLVPSGTLRSLLAGGPLPFTRIREIISQLGSALNYAHSQGMIHRDVKPGNVLIDETGNCLLTDFGLARMVDSSVQLTNSGATVGTPSYMSPEQGSGKNVDVRSDIYSLGIILYEMVTGRVPYKAETPIAVIYKHIQDPLPPAQIFRPDLPEAIESIILKALSKNPEDRYQTAGDMVRAIQTAVPDTLLLSTAKARLLPIKPTRRIPVWAWTVLGIATLFIILGGVLIGINKAPPTPEPLPTSAETTSPFQPAPPTREILVVTPEPVDSNTQAASIADPRTNHRIAIRCGEKSICILDGLNNQLAQFQLPELPGMVIPSDLSWAPDGNRIVIGARDEQDPEGDADLYILDVGSGTLTQLTASPEINNRWPSWSPKGDWIAFHASGEGIMVSPDGKISRIFFNATFDEDVDFPRWSPDSRAMAWIDQTDDGGKVEDISLLDMESKRHVSLRLQDAYQHPFNDTKLAWDPNGQYLYFEFWNTIQTKTYRINKDCLATGCTEKDFEQVKYRIPDSWLPSYYPQWADISAISVEPTSSAQLTAVPGSFGSALKIADLTAHGRIPYTSKLDLRRAITLEAWVKVQKFPTPCKSVWAESCGYVPIISQGHRSSTAGNFTLAMGQKGLLFTFETVDSRLMAYTEIPENEWIHIAISHTYGDSAGTAFYLNGSPIEDAQWMDDSAQPISGDRYPGQNSGSDYYIGQYGSEAPGEHFVGEIDELRIWSTARNSDEIIAYMNSELAGNEPGLVAYWNFNVQSGETVIPDASGNDHKIFLNGNTIIVER